MSKNEEEYKLFKGAITPAQAGNCSWLSLYALIKLIDLGYQGRVEIAEFRHLDHVFLVLNRPEKSDKNDWKTWGKECIILEPWLNEVITADQFGEFWKDKARFLLSKKSINDKSELKTLPTDIFETYITCNDNDFRQLRSGDKEKIVRPNFLK